MLHRLAAADSARKVWAALKPDRSQLAAYHAALRADPPAGFDADAVDRLFVEHGLYRQPFGNGSWDDWEPFLDDAPHNGRHDPGEPWGDLHYADMERLRPLREFEPGDALVPGQSGDASWTRDAGRARYSMAIEPSRQLQMEGLIPAAARVLNEPVEGAASAYVVAVKDGRVPIAIPAGRSEGLVSVAVPGGRTVWRASHSELRAQLGTSAGRLGPLARVAIVAADHPATAMEAVAVDGDPQRAPAREIGEVSDARVSWPGDLSGIPAAEEAPAASGDGVFRASVLLGLLLGLVAAWWWRGR